MHLLAGLGWSLDLDYPAHCLARLLNEDLRKKKSQEKRKKLWNHKFQQGTRSLLLKHKAEITGLPIGERGFIPSRTAYRLLHFSV